MSAREPLYRLWPRYRPGSVELGGAGAKPLLRTGLGLLAVALVLSLPTVARATTIPAPHAFALFGAYFACMVFNDYVLHPAAMRSPRGFAVQLVITPLYNVAFCTALVLLGGDPKTPLWMGLVLYATTTAIWQEIDAFLPMLLLHAVAPLLTIPWFLAASPENGWAIGGPLLTAVLSGASYHLLAQVSAVWRSVRRAQSAAIDALRAEKDEMERRRVAQDLHDSVGSALSVFGLSADLIERHAHHPAELHGIARALRESSREGLSELRGLLDAMAPEATTLGALATAVRRAGARMEEMTGRRIQVLVEGELAAPVEGPARLAAMRVFQESVNNCLKHGADAPIAIRVGLAQGWLSLETHSPGASSLAASEGDGRGLRGIRQRAEELGGRAECGTHPEGGLRVRVEFPAVAHDAAAGLRS